MKEFTLCFAYIKMFGLTYIASILNCFVRFVIFISVKIHVPVRNCQLTSIKLVPRPILNLKDWCLKWTYVDLKYKQTVY